jgi:hypothetical protein
MSATIGQIPLIPSFLDRVSESLSGPIAKAESGIFFWTPGEAKSFHLPAALKRSQLSKFLGKISLAQEVIYIDFLSDLENNFESFKTLLIEETVKKFPSIGRQNLRELFSKISAKNEIILILNQIDSYPTEEFEKIVKLLDKIITVNPNRIHIQIHLRSNADEPLIKRWAGQSPICRNLIRVPKPNTSELGEIINALAKNAGVNLTRNQVNFLANASEENISLAKTALRKLLSCKEFTTDIKKVVLSEEFRLKKLEIGAKEIIPRPDGKIPPLSELPSLSKTERRIISELTKSSKKFISREEVAEIIWGEASFEKFSDWAIDKTISRLRKKVALADPNFSIKTVKSKGYTYET